MIKRVLALAALGVLLSGCFMAPMALIGPAMSGYSTASIMQSGITSGANYLVKKNTGKSIIEHTLTALTEDGSLIDESILKQSYFPTNNIISKSELSRILRN